MCTFNRSIIYLTYESLQGMLQGIFKLFQAESTRVWETGELLSISELMAVALCYLATQIKWPNTQNRTVNSKNAMPNKFIFYTFQFIFLSFKT